MPCYAARPVPLLKTVRRIRAAVTLVAVASGLVGCSNEPVWGHASPVREPLRATAPAHGFGQAIAWQSLDEGLARARREARPLMLLVHASWCRSCKALRPAFDAPDLEALSEAFVMVNVDQDDDPRVREFAVDGAYVPRVLFLDPSTGTAVRDLKNPDRTQSLYYYSSSDELVGVMKKALARYGSSKPS